MYDFSYLWLHHFSAIVIYVLPSAITDQLEESES